MFNAQRSKFEFFNSNFELKNSKLKIQKLTAAGRGRRFFSKIKFAFLFLLLTAYCLPLAAYAQTTRTIAEVQGEKNVSPFVGERVRLSGIVTARTRTGFFIQTPDDKTDDDPLTSEGIFVFTKTEPGSEAAVGNLVTVTGQVAEFRPDSELSSLSVTQLLLSAGEDSIKVESKDNALPKPLVLTARDLKDGAFDALEKYEGMRVEVRELLVVAPTAGRVDIKNGTAVSNGTFYGVLKGFPRPFREPGYELYEFVSLGDKEKEKLKKDYPKLPFFDHNPERLRIESTAQIGAQPIDATTFAEIKNLRGVLHYAYRAYTIFVDADAKPEISGLVKASPLPATGERQFSVASINIQDFFDDQDDPAINEEVVTPEAFERRLKKISWAVRDYMMMPDVIGVVEAENQAALQRLAERINKDAVAAGGPDPKYEAYLIEGSDGRGIDNGFLVKSARVKKLEVQQFGKDERYVHPNGKDKVLLNDRPPLMLRAAIADAKTGKPFEFTVVVNHLKSFLGYNDPKQKDNVRLKKRLQAEFLARWVQERQKKDPSERIILVGDFNAYQFNDGILDLLGTIAGKPAPKDAVMIPSEDLVEPDLTNLVDFIKADQRYSYTFDGNAQVLDHILVNEPMLKHVSSFGYVRLNADFPAVYRNDDARVERFSDHDAAVAYFSFDEITRK